MSGYHDKIFMEPTHHIRQQASQIIDKIFFANGPRSVFVVKGKVCSCPVGGRLESKYIARRDSQLIGIYDDRATISMIIEDLCSAGVVESVQCH